MSLLSIPSPAEGVWYLGPVPLRAYALCIIAGVVVAVWYGDKRWVARGGKPGEVGDIAMWAVPAGIIGARVYHVITDWELYFGEGRDPLDALRIWQGGLAIWGAIAGGVLGAWIYCRIRKVRLLDLMDALAPGLLLAQIIGRWGNWFNQELFGRPTDLPWGLEIDLAHRPNGYLDFETFHPTFLYEGLWNLAAFALIVWLDRRRRLDGGRCFALYVMAYTAGRAWIENLRIDTVQYEEVLGLRLNVWTSVVLFALALAWFLFASRRARAGGQAEPAKTPASQPGDDTDQP